MSFIQHFVIVHSVLKYPGMFPVLENINDAINLVTLYNIRSEIIGGWLYCFTTDLIGIQLIASGFWHSYKHNAYVFSGRPKDGLADDETLDEIKARLGYQPIRGNHGKNQK